MLDPCFEERSIGRTYNVYQEGTLFPFRLYRILDSRAQHETAQVDPVVLSVAVLCIRFAVGAHDIRGAGSAAESASQEITGRTDGSPICTIASLTLGV